jgi:spore coat protein A, manganese oxidase
MASLAFGVSGRKKILINRRDFLLSGGLMSAMAVRLEGQMRHHPPRLAGVSLSPLALKKWAQTLPVPEKARVVRKGHYRIAMREFQAKIHPDLAPTTFWGYDGMSPGPTFEVRSSEPIFVEWVNDLPMKHLLPIDHALHGATSEVPDVRAVVHLHGGRVPPGSDGNPEKWFIPGQSRTCFYPNRQDSAGLFYHDHAMGITRLNAVAGLFGHYLIRDAFEDSLRLPSGEYEIPICIYDRLFQVNGQLQYPPAPWTADYDGNAILLNGKLAPFLEAEPRPYRFRLLNCSNGTFFTLSFSRDGLNLVPGSESFQVIGSDQGLLAAPVAMKSLTLTPGERADVVIDFSPYAGKTIYLKHASSPILQIRVSDEKPTGAISLPAKLRHIERTAQTAAARTRELTLMDYKDAAGRVTHMLLNDAHYDMPVTEKPVLNSTEIWTLVNLTDDTHPIHLHLVRLQILDRRRFDFEAYKSTGKLIYTGPPIPPEPHEAGWKDTVRADVLLATRIIVKFEGYKGRYVWHCHVLEHEDNEMMRPYEVV